MKKVTCNLAMMLAVVFSALAFYSCNGDDDATDVLAITTINLVQGGPDFYLTLDNGQTMLPTDIKGDVAETYADGQRAFAVFSQLEEPVNGYDFNICLKSVTPIPTREAIVATADEQPDATWGNDPINITYMWMTSDCRYLTIEYQYYGIEDMTNGAAFSLVLPDSGDDSSSTLPVGDALLLEFRHKNEGAASPRLQEGYVSFKLDKLFPFMYSEGELCVRVNSIYHGYEYHELSYSMPD